MEEIIAFCGINCGACPALIAKKEDNNALRQKTAEEWSKQFNHKFSPEHINCDGCVSSGVHIGYCEMCEIRKCGVKKKVLNCGHCKDYVCDKLEKWFKNIPDAKKVLDEINKTR